MSGFIVKRNRVSGEFTVLKGHGFSRAVERTNSDRGFSRSGNAKN